MAIPNDRFDPRAWPRWIAKNQATLDKCCLPEVIYATEENWDHFLSHGFLWLEPGGGVTFDLTWLKDRELLALREFLEDEAESEGPSSRDWYVRFFEWMDEEVARRRTKE